MTPGLENKNGVGSSRLASVLPRAGNARAVARWAMTALLSIFLPALSLAAAPPPIPVVPGQIFEFQPAAGVVGVCPHTFTFSEIVFFDPFRGVNLPEMIKDVTAIPDTQGVDVGETLTVRFRIRLSDSPPPTIGSFPNFDLIMWWMVTPASCGFPDTVAPASLNQRITYVPNLYFVVAPDIAPPDEGPCDGSASRSGCARTADPIDPATGNETFTEPDDYRSGDGRLRLVRTYNSLGVTRASLGRGWSHNFSSRRLVWTNQLEVMPPNTISQSYQTAASACVAGWAELAPGQPNSSGVTAAWDGVSCNLSSGQSLPVFSTGKSLAQPTTYTGVAAVRPSGSSFLFACQGASCTGNSSVALSVAPTASGYTLRDEEDTLESYDEYGSLKTLTFPGGYSQTFTYSNGDLASVTDSFGRTLTFHYDLNARLESVDTPSGQVQYSYDASGRLISVLHSDGATRTYSYTNSDFPKLLTGVTDENGDSYASVSYDALGRASHASLAGGALDNTVSYTTPGAPTVTDARGVTRTYQYSRIHGRDKLAAIVGPACSTCASPAAMTYDGAGYPQSNTDWNGNVTTFVYDASRGLEISRTEAHGTPRARTVTTQWDAQYRRPTLISWYSGESAAGVPKRTVTSTYDSSGNLLTRTATDPSVTPNLSRTWTYTYNGFGQVLTADGPRTDVLDVTTYTYHSCTTGSECGQIHTITNAAGHTTTYNTYDANGLPLTITDPNGVATTLAYDERQRLTSRTVGIEQTTFSYWPTGLVKKVTLPDGSFLENHYDAAHRLTEIKDTEGNRIVYTLDAMGQRIAEQVYDPSHALTQMRTRVFNALDQLSKEIGAAGTAAVATEFSHDGNGNQTHINAPLSRNTVQDYDELDRLEQVTDPLLGVTQYGYNALDQLISVTDPRNKVTSYTQNALGDLTQLISPDSGTTTYTYDVAGNVATKTDARSIAGTYSYDALNRVTSIAYPDQTLSFAYDSGSNALGRLSGASDANHSMAWSYDTLGRVVGKTQVVASVTRAISYGYTNGNLTSLVTPSGQTIAYGYAAGRISSVAVNGTTVLGNVLYEPFGPVLQWTWGNTTASMRSHDLDGNVSQLNSGGDFYEYTYDDAFRITGVTNTTDTSLSWNYGYDSHDRLTGTTSTLRNDSWLYDANGNRTSASGSAAGVSFANILTVSGTSNRVTSISGSRANTYGYDAAGNVSSETNAGRTVGILSTTTVSYLYNALSQRIWKSGPTNATLFVYDEAGHLIGEYSAAGALIQETVWMGDIPVATLRPRAGGGVDMYYVHTDHLNAPRKITRPSDDVVMWRWDPSPFGDTLPNGNPENAGTFTYNLRFPGQYYDAESGLSYNYYRDYDPATGRFLESDPTGLAGGINLYAYVGGNPISFVDPEGLHCLSPRAIKALSGALAGGISGLQGGLAGVLVGAGAGGILGAASADMPRFDGTNAFLGGAGTVLDGSRSARIGGGIGGLTGWAVSQTLGGGIVGNTVGGGVGGAVGGFFGAPPGSGWGTAARNARIPGLFGALGGLAGAALEKYLQSTREANCGCDHP